MLDQKRRISTLIETQLPGFISDEYENFSKFLEYYYEQLEFQGQPLDIINNLETYLDISTYDNKALVQSDRLNASVTASQTTLELVDGSSFPEENGYIKIGSEICFYKKRNKNILLEVSRGVSGNSKIGDLYEETEFVTTEASAHTKDDTVFNVSNFFLYALVKNFEAQYLIGFPEKYLLDAADKRTLIKYIGEFYRSKGTDRSINFIFNTILNKNGEKDTPITYNPKDFTIKASNSNWVKTYSLRVKSYLGSPLDLIGKKIEQKTSSGVVSAVVDNAVYVGLVNNEQIYELILAESSVTGKFEECAKTSLTKSISQSTTTGDTISVFSTIGWKDSFGEILIGSEVITFNDKRVSDFTINNREKTISYSVGTPVYSNSVATFENTKVIIFGVVYQVENPNPSPFAVEKDSIQITEPGFTTLDPIIYRDFEDDGYYNRSSTRWFFYSEDPNPSSTAAFRGFPDELEDRLNKFPYDVSAIYEDENYYYICSSGYPSTYIFGTTPLSTGLNVEDITDQSNLKLIRKNPINTTEVYSTGTRDVGIFVDGSLAYTAKDFDFVEYGDIEKVEITNKGRGYKNPPFVLINNRAGFATATLNGEVLNQIVITRNDVYKNNPTITITSGRRGTAKATVTNGKVTKIDVTSPGEYYSTAPIVRITDNAGRGRFAEYESIIDTKGRLTGFKQISQGNFYSQENIVVEIVPVGSEASAKALIKKWYRNRYGRTDNTSKTYYQGSTGFVQNIDPTKGFGFGQWGWQSRLANRLREGSFLDGVLASRSRHSRIFGYAYDGNPIYGPLGYQDPMDPESTIVHMRSGYKLKNTRTNGPSVAQYPLGSFVDDYEYEYTNSYGKQVLDERNGRFCVTPEYPNGTYAYFMPLTSYSLPDESETGLSPKYPYIIGPSYYSLPVDSNANSFISQKDLPLNCKRYREKFITKNGNNFEGFIDGTNSGNISGFEIIDSVNTFSVGSNVYFDNTNTEGSNASAVVSGVFGKPVASIQSKETKSVRIQLINNAYLFAGDTLTQSGTNASGTLLGDVANGTELVLTNVSGEFNNTDIYSASIQVVNLLLNQDSSYTFGSTIRFKDAKNAVLATGEVLEGTIRQNSVKLKVISGSFFFKEWKSSQVYEPNDYVYYNELFYKVTNNSVAASGATPPSHRFGTLANGSLNLEFIAESPFLQSSALIDTIATEIITATSLSSGLSPFSIDKNIAVVTTSEDHGITEGDVVNVTIDPDLEEKKTTYYVRKKYFQTIKLNPPKYTGQIKSTGVGRIDILNPGSNYVGFATYEDVELIFLDSESARKNIGLGGDPGNARATVNVNNNGEISSIIITDPGYGYKKGDFLTIPGGSLGRLGPGVNCILDVDHAGLAAENTTFKLDSVSELSNQDLLKIRNEIVKIESIDVVNKEVTVTRAVESTTSADHYPNETVVLHKPKYRFNFGDDIGNNPSDPNVLRYNEETNILELYFDLSSLVQNSLSVSSTFRDSSNPQKKVSVSESNPIISKLEFGTNPTLDSSFSTDLIIEAQKYYKYAFNTSHPSMQNVYIGLSPSKSQNLITTEIINEFGSGYFEVVFGYGTSTSSNQYNIRESIKYSNYYFFVRNDSQTQSNISIKLIDDPLQGEKVVDYVTNRSFVYSLDKSPQFDGSGSIYYTTSALGSSGKISSIAITNLGFGYKSLPVISGISVTSENESDVNVSWDPVKNTITDISVVDGGKNYYSPRIEIITGGGYGYKFQVLTNNRRIVRVIVLNGGYGYTSRPTVRIVESDIEIYPVSNNIGVPRNVKVVNPGSAFNTDRTLLSQYRSNYVLKLSGVKGKIFYPGEVVKQYDENDNITCQAIVSEGGWRSGSNLIRLKNVIGDFSVGSILKSDLKPNNFGTIKEIYVTDFNPILKSYFDNIGEYKSDNGKISVGSQKITDSYYYQDYSYVVKSKKSINEYRDLLKGSTHPAGFQMFGELMVDSEALNKMPKEPPRLLTNKIITLYDDNANLVTTSIVKERASQSISNVSFGSVPSERGLGSIAIEDFNLSETYANVIDIVGNFDGTFLDKDGNRSGTTTFGLIDSLTDLPYVPFNEYELVVTLDGIVQEPGVAYTISGSNIVFSEAPLGARDDEKTFEDGSRIFKWQPGKQVNSGDFVWHINGIVYLALTSGILGSTPPSHTTQTAANGSVTLEYSNLTKIPSTKFYCKSFRFKNNGTNARYLKKIRNIFQRNGRWLDAANQIDANKKFIQEETLGYIKFKYPVLNWNTFEQKCFRDIGHIVDGYSKDLRFGGNTFTVRNGKLYYDGNVLEHIDGQLNETLEAFEYAARLCKLAMRNWDYVYDNVTYFQGSDIMVVSDTSNVAIGMHVSAGDSYPDGTVIVDIISDTQLRLSNPASGAAGSELISNDTLIVQDTTTLTTTVGVSAILRVLEPYYYRVLAGGSNQATFYWSGVNTGTYYDASNLIVANKENIQKEASFAITDGYQLFQYPNQPLEASVYKDARRLLYKNKDFIADYIIDQIDSEYPGFGYGGPNGRTKCRRDLIYIIDALATDLGKGSNNNMINATKYYFDASNNLIDNGLVGELDEAIFAYTQLIIISNLIITNQGAPGKILDGITTLSGRTVFYDLDILNDPSSNTNDDASNCSNVQSSIDVLVHILIDALTDARDGNAVTYPQQSTGIETWYKYEEKCKRDIGYLIEDVAYHLKFGGNRKIVEFGKFYYQGTSNRVGFINNELNETVYAFNHARDLMISAMRNELSGDTIITAFIDPNVADDIDSPACAEVASSISSMVKIVEDTLKVGKDLYVITPENDNLPGNWSTTLSKSNYNLIPDPQLVASECEDVSSALSGLYKNLEKVLTQGVDSIPDTLIYSDYFNGVTKSFELYYEDGTNVVLDPNENLLVCINGIIQRPQHAPNLPLGDSYYIDRTTTPNRIVFSEAPGWDQNDNVKLLQEGLAVDKFSARTIGSYERLTVDEELINNSNAGPFVMKSVIDGKVKSISNPRYAMVFVDGVLQRDKEAYTIAGPAISFAEPLRSAGKQKQKVDIFLYYGKDTEQTATGFDYEIDTYFNRCILRIQKAGTYPNFNSLYSAYPEVSAYQIIDGKKWSMGSLRTYYQIDSTTWEVIFSSNNPKFDAALPLYFVANNNLEGDAFEVSGATLTLTFTTDLDGNRRMQKDVTKWMYDSGLNDPAWLVRNNLRGNLLPGDLIKIDGEDDYRTVIDTPAFVTSRNHLPGDKTSTNFYGQLKVSKYSGVRRGEGLSVTCEIDADTGKVTKLNWDDNSLDLYFNQNLNISPTAYQYFWTPVLNFVSIDGTGGGAEATVIVSGGQIVDVVLTKPGYGYTQPPNIVVSRGYERIKNNRKIDFFVNLNFVNKVTQGMSESVVTYVSIAPPNLIPGVTTIVDIRPGINPDDENVRRITNIITPNPDEVGGEHLTDPINYEILHTSVIAVQDLSVHISDNVVIDCERVTIPQTITATTEISRFVSFDNKTVTGIVDNGYFDYQLDYDGGVLGNRASQFTNAKFVGGGVLDTSINFVELDQWFPNITLEEWESLEYQKTSFTTDGQWNWGYPTETQYMTYVDTIAVPAVGAPGYVATNATIYAGSTRLFPTSGTILVGRELIKYTSKQSDRFIGCTRGFNGTPIESHDILDFIKTTYS